MPYVHSDPSRESQHHALPNVEIFYLTSVAAHLMNKDADADYEPGERGLYTEGWYYAFGLPGCLWDGEPEGPFETREEAISDMRGEG